MFMKHNLISKNLNQSLVLVTIHKYYLTEAKYAQKDLSKSEVICWE